MLSYVGRSGSLLPFHSATTQLLASPAKAIVPCVLEKSQVKVQMDVDQKKPTLVTGTINQSINQSMNGFDPLLLDSRLTLSSAYVTFNP